MKIYPVIHYQDDSQAILNAAIASKHGCEGVFLIDMNQGDQEPVERCAANIAEIYPNLVVGLNRLGVPAHKSVSKNIALGLRATWSDVCITHSAGGMAAIEQQTLLMGARMADDAHLCFVGVAFKYQPYESNPGRAAVNAHALGLIPTTSGPATGQSVDLGKLKLIRKALPKGAPLALASGVTPSNVHEYKSIVTHALVATGINKADGSELIDEALLLALIERSR